MVAKMQAAMFVISFFLVLILVYYVTRPPPATAREQLAKLAKDIGKSSKSAARDEAIAVVPSMVAGNSNSNSKSGFSALASRGGFGMPAGFTGHFKIVYSWGQCL